ncbi:hypothetical protein [Cytobacillus oceanisediminis]|uniref:hypothetical protein n=1 Tax=Cytobacillus oceanisediminis TaxID=665099 RepID=UPI0002DC8B38|nr:hypothetical protein [Cytobacillus oceanisediminis]MCM3400995.1 hypothetical protein [Cytobacillus oceanisediminis]
MKWFHEVQRFNHPIGKQYTNGHGPENQSDEERKERLLTYLRQENEILKMYLELEKELKKK